MSGCCPALRPAKGSASGQALAVTLHRQAGQRPGNTGTSVLQNTSQSFLCFCASTKVNLKTTTESAWRDSINRDNPNNNQDGTTACVRSISVILLVPLASSSSSSSSHHHSHHRHKNNFHAQLSAHCSRTCLDCHCLVHSSVETTANQFLNKPQTSSPLPLNYGIQTQRLTAALGSARGIDRQNHA